MHKVLMIVSEAPPVVSGIARVAMHMQQGLEALDYHLDVISLEDVPRFVKGEVRISSMLWKAPRVLLPRLADYDIVHIHGPVPTFSDVALLLSAARSKQRRPLIVYTHHAEIDLHGYYRPFCAVYNRAHKALARLADHVIVHVPAYARELGRYLSRDCISVVPLGVAGDWYSGDELKAERFTVLFVGQLRPYKGVETLLGAAARVKGVDVQIVGGGHHEGYYRELAAKLDLEEVTFRGRVDDAELREAYARAHVIVLPSTTRQEAFGLVVLEGMVAGCVPVVSQLPGVTDVVGDAGFSFPIGDEAALASILARLRDDVALRNLYSQRARERAQRFTWQRTVAGNAAIYERLLALRRFGRAMQAEREGKETAPSSAVRDENVPLQELLRNVITTLRASSGSIMLMEPRDEVLRVRAAHGLPEEAGRNGGQPIGQGIAGFVASRKEPLILPKDFGKFSNGELGRYAHREYIRSSLSVPIHTKDHLLGVMNLSSYADDRHFHADDLHWLNMLAHRAAPILVRNAAYHTYGDDMEMIDATEERVAYR